MAKVTYSPIKELIVHEIIRVATEDLLRERVTPQGTMPLYWCNGILFSFSSLPMSDDIVKDYLQGRIHWLEVHFATEAKYTPIMPLNEEEYKTAMNVRVIDTSKSDLHQELTKWIKSTISKK